MRSSWVHFAITLCSCAAVGDFLVVFVFLPYQRRPWAERHSSYSGSGLPEDHGTYLHTLLPNYARITEDEARIYSCSSVGPRILSSRIGRYRLSKGLGLAFIALIRERCPSPKPFTRGRFLLEKIMLNSALYGVQSSLDASVPLPMTLVNSPLGDLIVVP
ncbi:hypothetical protein BDV06DRAFT_6002 [Aspergillus oleicola]